MRYSGRRRNGRIIPAIAPCGAPLAPFATGMFSSLNGIQSIEIAGHTGRFLRLGHGDPLLLVASQLVRIQPYRPLFLRLAEHFSVTVLELPGSGGASKLRKGWNCQDYANWLEAFLEREPAQPLLIAHSTSCGAAISLAAHHPHLLR